MWLLLQQLQQHHEKYILFYTKINVLLHHQENVHASYFI